MKKTKMLKKNYEFQIAFSKGKANYGKYLGAFIKKNRKGYNLLGIAIGVKLAKANKRNHIKRLIRESYRKNEENIKNNYTIVFTWKKGADIENISYAEIEADMINIFKKAKILVNKEEQK